jgi:predicted GIY-YIG superfamily endonuclease
MAIFARWRPLDALPPRRGRDAQPGVYELADAERRTIYIGQSARDVPNRIRQHLAADGCVAQHAVFWRTAYSRVPQAEEAELLARHRVRTGGLPACNEATPRPRDAARRWAERSRDDG